MPSSAASAAMLRGVWAKLTVSSPMLMWKCLAMWRRPSKQLAGAGGPLQPSLFDDRDPRSRVEGVPGQDRDMAEITSPDYPGERLVVCKNPLLAEERARKRAELLAGTRTTSRALQPACSGR